jgi:hypothetical protein
MNPHVLALLIPIIGMGFTGLIVLSFTRLGKALAARLEGRMDRESAERIERLETELERTQLALGEVQERLDFAERVLARDATPPQLPPR